MSTPPRFVSAVSPSSSSSSSSLVVAVATNSQQQQQQLQQQQQPWRVLIYNHQGFLQTTLTFTNKHGQASSSKTSYIQKLLFLDDTNGSSSFLAAISSLGTVVVWDLNRGVVAYCLENHGSSSTTADPDVDDDGCCVLDAHSLHQDLYLLVQHRNSKHPNGGKPLIYHYRASKLVRKIKSGKHGQQMIVHEEYIGVAHGNKLRILSTSTGQTLRKMELPSSVVAMTLCLNSRNRSRAPNDVSPVPALAALRLDTGVILQVNLGEGSTEELATFSLAASTSSRSATTTLLEWSAECGVVLVDGKFRVDTTTATTSSTTAESARNQRGETKTLVDLATVEDGVVHLTTIAAQQKNQHHDDNNILVVVGVLYRTGAYQIQTGTTSTDSSLLFGWKEESTNQSLGDSFKSKAASTSSNTATAAILGPAQAGGQARGVQDMMGSSSPSSGPPSKKAKLEGEGEDKGEEGEEDEDETIAARLARFKKQLEADEAAEETTDTMMTATATAVPFQLKKVTTESLTQLVKQALTDDSILELCLAVRDTAILRETCSKLTGEEIGTLVSAITVRLAYKPGRADALCLWLQVLLQTRKVPLEVLQPLQNLLQERIEVFPALLKLEGRLSMLTS